MQPLFLNKSKPADSIDTSKEMGHQNYVMLKILTGSTLEQWSDIGKLHFRLFN